MKGISVTVSLALTIFLATPSILVSQTSSDSDVVVSESSKRRKNDKNSATVDDISEDITKPISPKKPTIAFLGDSIVFGISDTYTDQRQGYVGRLSQQLKKYVVLKHGFPGITSTKLFRKVKKSFGNKVRTAKLKKSLLKSNLVIFDVGRNDYWSDVDPSKTVRMIKKAGDLIRRRVKKLVGKPPRVGVSLLLPTAREFQQPFVSEVNRGLKRSSLEVIFDYSDLPLEVLSDDGLHPDRAGYSRIAQIAKEKLVPLVRGLRL